MTKLTFCSLREVLEDAKAFAGTLCPPEVSYISPTFVLYVPLDSFDKASQALTDIKAGIESGDIDPSNLSMSDLVRQLSGNPLHNVPRYRTYITEPPGDYDIAQVVSEIPHTAYRVEFGFGNKVSGGFIRRYSRTGENTWTINRVTEELCPSDYFPLPT